jgi:hypothetical protein
MSSESKKFPPNLAYCRSRKSSIDSRPRSDSSSSSWFCLKNHEFTFAPQLHPQKRVKASNLVPQSVKNSDIHFSADMVLEEVGMEDDNFIHLARSIAEQNEGFCLSETCESETFPLIFKCKLGHVWKSNEVLMNGSWCSKCKNLLDRAKHYADCYGGTCSNQICQILLDFECKNGHKWKADLSRYMYQKWCKQCIVEERNQKKNKIMKDLQAEEEEQARVQEQLFAEARQKLNDEAEVSIMEAEKEVEAIADDMARRYLENCSNQDPRVCEQVSSVYQVICASEAFIRAKYFGRKTKDQATTAFRHMARNLHPDKNSHPYASEAFLKISGVYASFMAEV